MPIEKHNATGMKCLELMKQTREQLRRLGNVSVKFNAKKSEMNVEVEKDANL